MLRLLAQPRECAALMQPGLDLARREQAQLPNQASEFYSELGRCRQANGERQGARQLFERSLALRREMLENSDVGEVENLMDLASLQADAGQSRQALQGFEQARRRLQQSVGDRHPLQVEISRNLAALRHDLGQLNDAERDAKEALAIALEVNGGQHPATMAVRRQLAAFHIEQGQYVQAQIELEQLRNVLTPRLGADHSDLAGLHSSLGLIAWERGDVDRALSELEYAVTISRKHLDRGRLAEALFAQATVLHATNRNTMARILLDEIRALRVAEFGAEHGLVGDTERLLGEVEIALDERDRGIDHLQRAVSLTRKSYGERHPNTRHAELDLAQVQALSGDAAALAHLESLSELPTTDEKLRELGWRAQAYAAQVRCGGPQRGQARATLDGLLRMIADARPDGSQVKRDVQVIRDACGG